MTEEKQNPWDSTWQSEYLKHRVQQAQTEAVDSRFVIRPIEEAGLNARIKDWKDLWKLKYGIVKTELLKGELDYTTKWNTFFVGEVVGIPESGKSEAAQFIAKALKRRYAAIGINSHIHIGFEISATLEFVKQAKAGDIIIQDEIPDVHGSGALIEQHALLNCLKEIRASRINFIFVSPEPFEKLVLPNAIVEVCGKELEHRFNRCVLYDRMLRCLGWCYVPLHNDDAFREAYEKTKMENIERLKAQMGYVGARIPEERIQETVAALIATAKQYIREVGPIETKTDFTSACVMVPIPGGVDFGRRVLHHAYRMFLAEQIRENIPSDDIEDGLEGEEQTEPVEEEGEIEPFQVNELEVLERLPRISVRDREIYRMSLEGRLTQQQMGEHYSPPLAQSSIATIVDNVRSGVNRILGGDFERWVERYYKAKPEVERVERRGQQNAPDVIVWFNDGRVRIINAKTTHKRGSVTYYSREFGTEWEYAVRYKQQHPEVNVELYLSVFNRWYNMLHEQKIELSGSIPQRATISRHVWRERMNL